MKFLILFIFILFTFSAQIFQGIIALSATAYLSRGEWLSKLRKEHFKYVNFLLFPIILFLFILPFIELYPWGKKEGIWFNSIFFVFRNIAFLSLNFFLAYLFKKKQNNKFAVLYLISFVLTQSLIAFDVILPLEYPFYSTLYGGYFFIESLLLALGINHFLIHKKETEYKESMYKNSSMIFGFSIIWAGFLFAQYLVIWYGNIPEETHFLLKRISYFPYNFLSVGVLLLCFFMPFFLFLPKKPKNNLKIGNWVSISIIIGLLIERIVIILPAIK